MSYARFAHERVGRFRLAIGSVAVAAGVFAIPGAQLPPEIMADRHLLRAERLIDEKDYRSAKDELEKIATLLVEHGVVVPEEFHFRYAQVASQAGLNKAVIDSLNTYLATAGRTGKFYRQALEMLDSAEEKLRKAEAGQEAERRQAEAESRLAEARRRQKEELARRNEELAQRQVEEARTLPRDVLRTGGLGPEMVKVATGRFQYFTYQGRDHFQWVAFDRLFAIGKYEVTRGEFERFVERSRYRTEAGRSPKYGCDSRTTKYRRKDSSLRWNRPGFDQTDAHPVTCVSIRDAMEYAKWLSHETGHSYRVPSAAEWQYAARAGSSEAMVPIFRADPSVPGICSHANVDGCSDGVAHTAEVGQLEPNGIGVHDMIGNVAELVLACGHVTPDGYTRPAPDGSPEHPDRCEELVIAMGAAFYHAGNPGRFSSYRTWMTVKARPYRDGDGYYRRSSENYVGFRVVRDLQDQAVSR